jgi:hypothetical protein
MIADGKTFVRVDDRVLIKTIGQARRQLVFVAPGVRKQVAEDRIFSEHDRAPEDQAD